MADLVKVFVYGTLKRGFPNHRLLENPPQGIVKFLMSGHTRDKYPLVVATDANVPCVLPLPGEGELVQGEIYEVDQEALSALDALERHPTWYKRTPCPVTITEGQQTTEVMCDIYFLNNHKKELLTLPFLSSYTQEHSSKFVPLAERSLRNVMEQSQDV